MLQTTCPSLPAAPHWLSTLIFWFPVNSGKFFSSQRDVALAQVLPGWLLEEYLSWGCPLDRSLCTTPLAQPPPGPQAPWQVQEAQAAGLAQAHMNSQVRAMRRALGAQEAKGR